MILMLSMLNAEAPALVNIVCCCSPLSTKAKLEGFSSTTVPVPARLMVCGLSGALSVMDRVPLRLPMVVGVKVT